MKYRQLLGQDQPPVVSYRYRFERQTQRHLCGSQTASASSDPTLRNGKDSSDDRISNGACPIFPVSRDILYDADWATSVTVS